MPKTIVVERPGDSKPNPFTICILANPGIERPSDSGNFVADPILLNNRKFRSVVDYVIACLFGRLPQQAEQFLADTRIEPHIKIVSIFDDTVVLDSASSLVAEMMDLVTTRRGAFIPFLSRYGLTADVVFAVTDSNVCQRSSAWYSSDDDGAPGVKFTMDGVTYCHTYTSLVPGTIALHTSADSMVALHEFSHALSSYKNGKVVDLYGNYAPALNSKLGNPPTPPKFVDYNNYSYLADVKRLPGGRGVHGFFCCELNGGSYPALMDDFWLEPTGLSVQCEHDKITRIFLQDRILAKINRP